MRLCPLCESSRRELLYGYVTTHAGQQGIFACGCGMVYAESEKKIDYSNSIYSMPNAYGSGESEMDRVRLDGVAKQISAAAPSHARIIDIGCARGGMMDALKRAGFTNLTGLDPSKECANEAADRGHKIVVAKLGDPIGRTFDLAILSHVLEHVEDVLGSLSSVLRMLTPDGHLYVEVPDVASHTASHPMLEFNSEHINHFTKDTLRLALEKSGFYVRTEGRKSFAIVGGSYPAIWAIAERRCGVASVMKYIENSRAELAAMDAKLFTDLNSFPDVIIWGAGEYLAHVLPMLRTKRIVQIIDRSPTLQGRIVEGIKVESPDAIHSDCPIVISAIVAAKTSIRADIESRRLPNRVITL